MKLIKRGMVLLLMVGGLAYADNDNVKLFNTAVYDANLSYIEKHIADKDVVKSMKSYRTMQYSVSNLQHFIGSKKEHDSKEKITIMLLEHGAGMYYAGPVFSILEIAIMENYVNLTKYLLEHADIEHYYALRHKKSFFYLVKSKKMLDLLIEKGLGDINYEDNGNNTVLHLILREGLMYDHGLNCKNIGELKKFLDTKNYFYERPIDMYVTKVSTKEEMVCFDDLIAQMHFNKKENDTLFIKMINRHFPLSSYEKLIKKGINLNSTADGKTALELAIIKKNQKLAELLITEGADINIVNDVGETALFLAKEKNMTELVKLLEKKKAKILTKEEMEKRYYIQEYLSELNYGKSIQKLKKLVHLKKVSINTTSNGKSPLSFFMRGSGVGDDERLAIINFLIDEGIDLNLGEDTAETLLAKALEHNRIKVAKKLMKKGAKLEGDEVMRTITNLGDKEFILELVKQQPKFLIGVDIFAETLLTKFASNGKKNLKFFNELLEYVDVKSENSDGTYNNLFRLINLHGRNDEIKPFIESMLSHGYKTTTKLHNRKTLLMVALESASNIDIVKLILNHNNPNGFMDKFFGEKEKIDLGTKSKDGQSLAHFMALAQTDVLKYMMKRGVKVDVHGGKDDVTPLMIAIKNNRQENIALLLDKSTINHEDKYGKTALNYVEEYDYSYMLRALKNVGAVANSQEHIEKKSTEYALTKKETKKSEKSLTNEEKKEFLKKYKEVKREKLDEFIRYYIRVGDSKAIELLLSNGLDINHKVYAAFHKEPLLITAIAEWENEVAKLLIEKGADIHALVEYDNGSLFKNPPTALSEAIMRNNKEMVALLLEKGARVDSISKKDDIAPLLIALKKEEAEIAQMIIKKGCNINIIDEANDMTPLMYAAHYGYLDTVKMLVEKGAKLDNENYSGNTAYDLAQKKGYGLVVEYLRGVK